MTPNSSIATLGRYEVLAELGFSEDEVTALRASGAAGKT